MEGYSLCVARSGLLSAEHVEEAVAPALSRRLPISHVHSHHVRRGEGAPDVPLWLGDDDVHLRREHAPQRHSDAQAHREGCGDDLVV